MNSLKLWAYSVMDLVASLVWLCGAEDAQGRAHRRALWARRGHRPRRTKDSAHPREAQQSSYNAVGPRALLLSTALLSVPTFASTFELFAKGSVSKNHIDNEKYILSVSAMTGLAVTILPRVRVEGRYTNTSSLQNSLDITNVATLTDVMTETSIYSVGIDFDVLGQQSSVQPFIYLGVGYVESKRSFYVTLPGAAAFYAQEPIQTGVSGNLGAGFRVSIARALAFEVEGFAYAVNIHKPNPVVNLFGSVGIRLYM